MIIDVTNGNAQGVAYWQAERLLVKMQTSSNEVLFGYYEGGVYNQLAQYTPVNGEVDIDVTDFVRAYPSRVMYFYDTSVTRLVNVEIVGRINPAGVLIPKHPLLDAQVPALVIPPQKMLLDVQNSAFVMAEFYSANPALWDVQGFAQWSEDERNLTNFNTAGFTLFDGIVSENYRPELADPCRPIALVEWQSFSGAQRKHVFYIVKQTNETAETIKLENMLNEYTEIKGEEDGFSLLLEDLTRYDFWYYADIITSSRVRVSIDGGATFHDVEVTDKKYTVPESDAGRLATLEVTIKFRKYDTI